jgi:NAD(P)-dependent dehydrogenase (short-subunit alcohol dehydrogenase family)
VLTIPGDVSDEGAVRGMVEAVMAGFGRVDVLVNNAGISLITPAENTSLADWRRTIPHVPRVRQGDAQAGLG